MLAGSQAAAAAAATDDRRAPIGIAIAAVYAISLAAAAAAAEAGAIETLLPSTRTRPALLLLFCELTCRRRRACCSNKGSACSAGAAGPCAEPAGSSALVWPPPPLQFALPLIAAAAASELAPFLRPFLVPIASCSGSLARRCARRCSRCSRRRRCRADRQLADDRVTCIVNLSARRPPRWAFALFFPAARCVADEDWTRAAADDSPPLVRRFLPPFAQRQSCAVPAFAGTAAPAASTRLAS